MEHFFSFPVPRMSLGMIQMECPMQLHPTQTPSPPLEYSLNPNAVEFVPSYRQQLDCDVAATAKTKTEATSTTTLLRPEMVGDALDQVENGFLVQRQIFECLSQLGDEQMPLEEVSVGLLPGGQGLTIRFTTKPKAGELLQPPDPNEPIFHKGHTLQLEVGDPQKLASRPESVLVSQFLFRINDLLREKYEDGGDLSICPKCTLCSNRSYTELEIEQQIEGIKAFENFTFTESTRYQDLVSHKAFKELCRRLGLIVSRDQIHINRASSRLSTAVSPPPPSAQPSEVTVATEQTTNETETETDADGDGDAYAGDDESQSNGDELTPKGSGSLENSTEYVRGKLYRYEDSEGSQLVNQLTEADPQCSEPMTIDVSDDSAHPTTPAKSVIAPSMPTTFPRLYKSAKAKCSHRGAGTSGLQGGSQLHRPTPYSRAVAQAQDQASQPTQRCRLTGGGGAAAAVGTSTARKHQTESFLPVPTRKQNNYLRATAPKSELGCQQAATRQARQPITVQKQTQSNHLCKAAKGSSSKQQNGTAQRMIPRSTTTSLMRQSEVKRRMSLLRGESDSDMLFSEYLFK